MVAAGAAAAAVAVVAATTMTTVTKTMAMVTTMTTTTTATTIASLVSIELMGAAVVLLPHGAETSRPCCRGDGDGDGDSDGGSGGGSGGGGGDDDDGGDDDGDDNCLARDDRIDGGRRGAPAPRGRTAAAVGVLGAAANDVILAFWGWRRAM